MLSSDLEVPDTIPCDKSGDLISHCVKICQLLAVDKRWCEKEREREINFEPSLPESVFSEGELPLWSSKIYKYIFVQFCLI